MGEVITFNKKRVFNLDDARDILSIVRRVTEASQAKVQRLTLQINYIENLKTKAELQDLVVDVFNEWQNKVRKLGAEAKGMWLVDFDSGDGYYCWRYPESDIAYFHGYYDGFQGRVKLH